MPEAALIDPELAAFLQRGVSVHVSSRGPTNIPNLVRGIGCRVSADRRQVTAFVLASQCGALLAELAMNGAISFVATLPSTHRTVQLKGTDAKAGPPLPGDEALVARERAALVEDLVGVGYAPEMPRTLLGGDWAEAMAITFTPTAAFVQTPGPGAGTPLGAGAR